MLLIQHINSGFNCISSVSPWHGSWDDCYVLAISLTSSRILFRTDLSATPKEKSSALTVNHADWPLQEGVAHQVDLGLIWL
jgi:hypothetical protein